MKREHRTYENVTQAFQRHLQRALKLQNKAWQRYIDASEHARELRDLVLHRTAVAEAVTRIIRDEKHD